MVYVLYTIFFASCIVLVGSVLLQPGKTDAGALFTSNISSSAFAPRGTTSVLSKVTIGAAIFFMMSALLLAMPVFNGNVSVLSSNPETAAESNANTDSNTAATVPDANANASANTATPDNSNGSLIETPATDQFANKAANTAATGNPAGNANAGKPAANTAANKVAPAKSPSASNKK